MFVGCQISAFYRVQYSRQAIQLSSNHSKVMTHANPRGLYQVASERDPPQANRSSTDQVKLRAAPDKLGHQPNDKLRVALSNQTSSKLPKSKTKPSHACFTRQSHLDSIIFNRELQPMRSYQDLRLHMWKIRAQGPRQPTQISEV